MKEIPIRVAVVALFLGVLASCSDDKNPAQQYGDSMAQSYKKAKEVDNKVNVQQVRKSIQEFYAANGRYPADLGEVASFNGMELKKDNFTYDPATGSLMEKQ